MKKQKVVFNSSELAHVWANKSAPIGRSPSNMRFDGDQFISYATTIANRIKHKGKEAYVLDQCSFSPSTSGHQGAVQSAISKASKVFHVHCGRRGQSLSFTPASLRDYYLDEFKSMGNDAPSKYVHKRADDLLSRLSRLNSAIEVCEFFGLGSLNLKKLRMSFDLKAAEARKVSGEYQEKLKTRREKVWERERKESQLKHEAAVANAINQAERFAAGEVPTDIGSDLNFGYEECLLEDRDDLKQAMRDLRNKLTAEQKAKHVAEQVAVAESFINKTVKFDSNHYFGWKHIDLESRPDLIEGITKLIVEDNKDAIEKWLAGENVKIDSDVPPHFRLEGDEVVTSMGARVPIDHAERSFKFCMAMKERGWKRNGHTHHVGMYQIDEINSVEIVAGCHHIQWSILIAFGKKMGWTV